MNIKMVVLGSALFLAGAASGSAVTYFVAKQRIEARAEREIDEAREFYMQTRPLPNKEESAKENIDIGDPAIAEAYRKKDQDASKSLTLYNKVAEEYRGGATAVSKPSESGSEHGEDPVESGSEDDDQEADKQPDADENEILNDTITTGVDENPYNVFAEAEGAEEREEPYIITYDDYTDTRLEYEKRTLHFYGGDNTLTDDNTTLITDPGALIGEATDFFGVGSKDPNVVYVRNDNVAQDFEIVLFQEGFAAAQYGFEDVEPKQPVRKMRQNYD